jgi:hypothetical protein
MIRRAPDSSIEPGTRTVSIINAILPNQHLHEHRNWLLVRGYRSCGKSNSPAPLTEKAHYSETRKSKISTRKRNFKGKRPWVETSDLSTDTKKHTTKFGETILLNSNIQYAARL